MDWPVIPEDSYGTTCIEWPALNDSTIRNASTGYLGGIDFIPF
jgi:hypothetical protein